jgi:lysozyme
VRLPSLLLFAIPLLSACAVQGDGEVLGTAQQPNVCASGTTLEGVDVSFYDATIDWASVKSSGRAFAIAKATEGSTIVDPQFATNWPGMKAAGVVRSAYHFFHCSSDPVTQASFFLGVMGPLEQGDLPPSLDFEDTTTCSASTGISMAIQWLDAVAAKTGTLPIIYTSVHVLSQFTNPQALAGHAQLWVANWGVSCPNVPSPYTDWVFWQYSATGTVPGIPTSNGAADLDQFNGDMNALLALTVGGSATTSTSSSSSSTSGGPPCVVMGVAGTCIDTSICATMPGYQSTPGFCPGPVNEQCCTPKNGVSSSSSSSSGGAGGAGTGGAGAGGATSAGAGAAHPSTSGAGAGLPGQVNKASGCSMTASGGAADPRAWALLLALAALASRTRRRQA